MIFRSVQDPTVNRHRALGAEPKRFSEVTAHRGSPPIAVDRHGVVVACGDVSRDRSPQKDAGKPLTRSYLRIYG